MLTNVKKKITRLMGKFSEASRDGTTSIQTEIESPEGVLTTSEYIVCDCGHHFDPSKIFVDKWSGKTVCEACCVTCWCGRKVWVEVATKVGDAYLCPDHKVSGMIRLAMEAITKRRED
jgi:hypothetical protein